VSKCFALILEKASLEHGLVGNGGDLNESVGAITSSSIINGVYDMLVKEQLNRRLVYIVVGFLLFVIGKDVDTLMLKYIV
jgi:hypothetical protein